MTLEWTDELYETAPEVVPLRPPSSWATALDLGPVLRGEQGRLEPKFLVRSDGKAAFYAGRVNHLIGASEASKTMVTLIPVREALLAGGRAFFLDFEDDVVGIVARLVAMGVPASYIERGFFYLNPEGRPDLNAFVEQFGPFSAEDLVIVDAVTAALAEASVNGNADVEVTGWLTSFAKPLSRLGPCLVLLDHVGKDSTRGARGSSAKLDAVSGVQLTAVRRALLSPGSRGVTSLEVTKDRIGSVRAASLSGAHFGDAILDATEPGSIVASIEPPLANPYAVSTDRVARAIASLDPSPDNPTTTKAVQEAAGAPFLTARRVQEALAELHASGQVGRRMVGRTAFWWIG